MLRPLLGHGEQLRIDVALLRPVLNAQPQAVVADAQQDHLRVRVIEPANAVGLLARLRAHEHGVPRRIGEQALERIVRRCVRRFSGRLRRGCGRRLGRCRLLRRGRRFRTIGRFRCFPSLSGSFLFGLFLNLLKAEQLAEDVALDAARLHGKPELAVALHGTQHVHTASPWGNLADGLRPCARAAAHVDRSGHRVAGCRPVHRRVARFLLRRHNGRRRGRHLNRRRNRHFNCRRGRRRGRHLNRRRCRRRGRHFNRRRGCNIARGFPRLFGAQLSGTEHDGFHASIAGDGRVALPLLAADAAHVALNGVKGCAVHPLDDAHVGRALFARPGEKHNVAALRPVAAVRRPVHAHALQFVLPGAAACGGRAIAVGDLRIVRAESDKHRAPV